MLCFELGVDIEEVPKGTISEVAVELVNYFERRNQIPDLLRKLEEERENINWRELVEIPVTVDKHSEYEREVLLEIGMACHKWKNEYLKVFQTSDNKKQDIWEVMLETVNYEYSKANWEENKYLFDEMIDRVTQRLEFICAFYGDALDDEIKALIVREVRMLRVEQTVYGVIPDLLATTKVSQTNEFKNGIFSARFQSAIKSLAKLARRVERDYLS